jgi:hypothetical protein
VARLSALECRAAYSEIHFILVPKLYLGTQLLKKLCFDLCDANPPHAPRQLHAKRSFRPKCVPKYNLGTRTIGSKYLPSALQCRGRELSRVGLTAMT